MAKQGLIRVPYFPQLKCLNDLHEETAHVLSVLLYRMSRDQNAVGYCRKRHDYQLALHLNTPYEKISDCMDALKEAGIMTEYEVIIKPKEITENSKDRIETHMRLDFNRLHEMLQRRGLSILDSRLLIRAADDSFDMYDVIDLNMLPLVQTLKGTVSKDTYEKVAAAAARFMIRVNEHCENIASDAIAPGWKMLLNLPAGKSEEEYAEELCGRFLRKGERAIDFSLNDGNIFIPDCDEIQNKEHTVRHYRKHRNSMILAAALMLCLNTEFSEYFTFTSELTAEQLRSALILHYAVTGKLPLIKDGYFDERKLSSEEKVQERKLISEIGDRIIREYGESDLRENLLHTL